MPRVALTALIVSVVALAAASAAPAAGTPGAAAARAIERDAARVRALVRRPADARLPAALAVLERSARRAGALPGARTGAAAADLRRVRAGLRAARAARTAARRGRRRLAARAAARARRRLAAPLSGVRALGRAAPVPPPPAPAPAPPSPPPPVAPVPAPAPEPTPAATPIPERTSGYEPVDLPPGERPYDAATPYPLTSSNVDAEGVRRYTRDGKDHHHPGVIELYASRMLNGYRLTGDPEYLRRARVNADRLLADEHVVRTDAGLWLAYDFDVDVFYDPAERLAAPWHSGLSQGHALKLFHELEELELREGEPVAAGRWRRAADDVYATAFAERRPGERWFRFTDDDGYVWFEEYPGDAIPPRVWNGHVVAVIGFWKRALVTGDPEARRLFDAGATTALHYAEVIRRPGDYSAYSIRTPWQIPSYQSTHIRQLRELAAMTGDARFETLAEQFEDDLEAAEARG